MKKVFFPILLAAVFFLAAENCRAQSNLSAPLRLERPLIQQAFETQFSGGQRFSYMFFNAETISAYRSNAAQIMAAAGFSSFYAEQYINYALEESPSGMFVLAFESGQAVAASICCARFPDTDEAVLISIGVIPQYRRLGIGKDLWRAMISSLVFGGYESVYLELQKNKNNEVIVRWIREMEQNGELSVSSSGIASDFHPDMVFYLLNITGRFRPLEPSQNGFFSHLFVRDAI